VVEHGLEGIEQRLGRQISVAADSLVRLLAADADSTAIASAERALHRQTTALRAWAQTQLALRESTEVLGGYRLRREPPFVTPHPRFPR